MRIRSERGSTIVEMTFIFPIIVFLLVIMLFYGMFMYEQVATKAILDNVLARAAANWATADKGIDDDEAAESPVDFSVWEVYSRILDFKDGKKRENIQSEALGRLRRACLLKHTFQPENIQLESRNFVVYKSLKLTVTRQYPLPFPGFLKWLGVQTHLDYVITGTAVVQDQPETIRNIDLAADILRQTGLKSVYDKLQSAMGSLVEFFQNFKVG